MINFSFYVTWLYANMFNESINKLKLNSARLKVSCRVHSLGCWSKGNLSSKEFMFK